jgi:hypothetical protein
MAGIDKYMISRPKIWATIVKNLHPPEIDSVGSNGRTKS